MHWRKPVENLTDLSVYDVPDWNIALRTVHDPHHTFCTHSGGKASGLSAEFAFRRLFTIHLMQTFFPSVMIMMCSAMSVFVPPELVPGRMGLCITAFLSMISLFNGARYLQLTIRVHKPF